MNKFIWKLIRKHKKVREMERLFSNLTNHIWDNACFKDINGEVDFGKSNETIAQHWNYFHKINKDFIKICEDIK